MKRAIAIACIFVASIAIEHHGALADDDPPGKSCDFDYDGRENGHPERAWFGRVYVPTQLAKETEKPVPLLVFIHGINKEAIKYRWFGGGNEGDVRKIVQSMIDAGAIPPIVVAAPSQIKEESTANAMTAWPSFDLDHFVGEVEKALGARAKIDRKKIVVAGHSGGACNKSGGLFTAMRAKLGVFAALSIDGCMFPDLADEMTSARPEEHMIVSWQEQSWDKRPFGEFKKAWKKALDKNPASDGALRVLDFEHVKEDHPHDAMVKITLEKYLPRLLAPAK